MTAQSQYRPSGERTRVLLIGDDRGACTEIRGHVIGGLDTAAISEVASMEEVQSIFLDHDFDLVLLHHGPQTEAPAVLQTLNDRSVECPILVVLDADQEELAGELLRRGAEGYILKTPGYGQRLRASMAALVEHTRRSQAWADAMQASQEQLHGLLEHSSQGILLQIDGEIVFANRALARTLGYDTPEQILELGSVFKFVDILDQPRMRRIVRQRGDGNDTLVNYEFRARRRDGQLIWLENHVSTATWEGRSVVQCVLTDISERHLAGNALRLASRVAVKAGEAGNFNGAVRTALRWLCRGMGWAVAESWIPDCEEGCLRQGPVWHQHDEKLQEFIHYSGAITFGVGESLPGRVWASGKPEWITDLSSGNGVLLQSIRALRAGLNAACGIPIFAEGKIVIVLCFFLREQKPKDDKLVDVLASGTAALGPILRQQQAEEARSRAQSQMETLIASNVDGILVVDAQDDIVYANPAALAAFGRDFESLRGLHFGHPAVNAGKSKEIEIQHPELGTRIHGMRTTDIEWHSEQARLISLRDVTESHRMRSALEERIKEMRCLYAASSILIRRDTDWNTMLQEIANTMPAGWMYPDITCARIRTVDFEAASPGFQETPWRLQAEITLDEEKIGDIEVFYLVEKPPADKGPFLREEADLLNEIALRISESLANRRYERALIDSCKQFRDYAESASDWLWEMDENLRFTYFSERIVDVMGHPVDHWLGKQRANLSAENIESDQKWRKHQSDLEARRPFRSFRYAISLPGGRTKHISISGVPVFDESGNFRGYRGTGTDETEEVRAKELARESERRLEDIADRLPGMVFQRLRKSDGTIEYPYVSAGVSKLLGLEEDVIRNDPLRWSDLVHPEDRSRFDLALSDSARTLEPMELTFRMRTAKGDECWIWHRSGPRELANGDTLWDCIELDVTKEKQYEERVRYLGYHDQITGLPNRDLFEERVNQVLPIASRNKQAVSVAILNLKQFKRVNEELGMFGGDEALRLLAQRFRQCLRPGDTVARLGGDRFLFLLPGVGERLETHVPLDRLAKAMTESITIRNQQILLGFNMGIAVFPKDGDSSDQLIRKAEMAQTYYRRWGPGYGYTFFQDDMSSSETSELTLERELKDAIDGGEQIEGFFQPIHDSQTGRIVAAETLARWRHPKRGLIPPIEFIGIAEESGLILPLGYQIFRQACTHARRWQTAGLPPVNISVNLSAKQIFDPDLAANIKRILTETGFDAGRVVLEVTESVLISNLGHAKDFMGELVAAGLQFALDDFGVGYSSLNYLGQLPIQVLKIDRSFIRDMDKTARNKATVKAIIALGRALDLHIIAEGIETDEQMRQVKNLGCDALQGFLLDKPMTAPEFEKRLSDRQ